MASFSGHPSSRRGERHHARTHPTMASQVLRALEARGLLTREADPRIARVRRVGVMPEGSRLARQAIRLAEAANESFFTAVADRGALLDTLRRPTSRGAMQARP